MKMRRIFVLTVSYLLLGCGLLGIASLLLLGAGVFLRRVTVKR
ncbi:MAG TPA: hypothetical protein VEL72_03055 [Ktedonobacteraceae bacterium]|nr:hypothetical protein [Ktedonobacteraceae bacterium]